MGLEHRLEQNHLEPKRQAKEMGLILQCNWNPLKAPQEGLEMNRISYSEHSGAPGTCVSPTLSFLCVVGELLLRPHFRWGVLSKMPFMLLNILSI